MQLTLGTFISHFLLQNSKAMRLLATFYHGMTALALITQTGSQLKRLRLRRVIRSSRKLVHKLSEKSPVNFEPIQKLIDAEYAAVFLKESISTEHTYRSSIEHFSKAGRTHFEALACEKFGMYHLKHGNREDAKEKLRRAHELYHNWGKCTKFLQTSYYTNSFDSLN